MAVLRVRSVRTAKVQTPVMWIITESSVISKHALEHQIDVFKLVSLCFRGRWVLQESLDLREVSDPWATQGLEA